MSTTYTRQQVTAAVNAGVDLVAEETGRDDIADRDNLIVNATLTLLDDPDATFEDVAERCYATDADRVRSWL